MCLGTLQKVVYHQKITDIDHHKQVPNSCWDVLGQVLINGATATVVETTVVGHSLSGWTNQASFLLIPGRLFVANSIYDTTLL